MSVEGVNVDLMAQNGSQGELAGQLAGGGLSVNQMRPFISPEDGRAYITVHNGGDPKKPENYSVRPVSNATLRRDEWKQLDDAVLMISEERLRGVADLRNAGLVRNLNNAMGTTVFEYHDVSDALSAVTTMDGITRGQNDRPNYETNYIPLPIVHADYEINERVLQNSRNMGNPIDTTLAERASRKVNEALEEMLFTDTTYSYGGGTIHSYLNHPNRNQAGFQQGTWTASATTPGDMVQDVLNMKQASIDAFHFGPWRVYVPTSYETVLDDDYDVSGSSIQTIRQRIEMIEGIQGVRVIDKLPADTVIMVEMTTDVVRWINGMNIQNVQWDSQGGMVHYFKVMTIQVPQVRSDQEGNSGLVHLS